MATTAFVWTLSKSATFEASHRLPLHSGKCRRLHGHSWKVVVEVGSNELGQHGSSTDMAVDFGDVGAPLKALVEDSLDHYHLNGGPDGPSTGLANPTSERVARWIFDKLEPVYEALGVTLTAVTVEETCTSRARYEP